MRNKAVKTVVAVALRGRVSNQEASAPAKKYHPEFPEIEIVPDTFKISVSDGEKKEVYKNDAEPFEFYQVPSLVSLLRLKGAKLSDDQIQFINEALSGEETGKAVAEILEDANDTLRVKAKNNRYQNVFNQHKPLDEESKDNAYARMVRDAMRTKNVSDESALQALQEFGFVPKEYTLEAFRAK